MFIYVLGISLEVVNQIIVGVVAAIHQLPTTQPETEPESPPNVAVSHISPIPIVPTLDWEIYIPLPKDYYLNKLFPRFLAVNGLNRFRIIKHSLTIIIQDGSQTIFRCRRNISSNQRNLYLELHSCGYDCAVWINTYSSNHNMDDQNVLSPPLS